MNYRSKKNPDVIAKLESTNDKYGTAILTYLSGPDKGKNISITISTLKRWWSKDSSDDVLNLDMEKVNTPYSPDVKPRYIKKPQSVIEYEEKQRGKRVNKNLPDFETVVNDISEFCSKVNDKSLYVKLKDGSTVWKKQAKIDAYVTDKIQEPLTNEGLICKPNKDTARPFWFVIETSEQYSALVKVIKEINWEE